MEYEWEASLFHDFQIYGELSADAWNFGRPHARKSEHNALWFGASPTLEQLWHTPRAGACNDRFWSGTQNHPKWWPTLVIHHPRLDHIVTFTAHEAVQPASYDSALVVTGEDWELISDVKISLGGNVGLSEEKYPESGGGSWRRRMLSWLRPTSRR